MEWQITSDTVKSTREMLNVYLLGVSAETNKKKDYYNMSKNVVVFGTFCIYSYNCLMKNKNSFI